MAATSTHEMALRLKLTLRNCFYAQGSLGASNRCSGEPRRYPSPQTWPIPKETLTYCVNFDVSATRGHIFSNTGSVTLASGILQQESGLGLEIVDCRDAVTAAGDRSEDASLDALAPGNEVRRESGRSSSSGTCVLKKSWCLSNSSFLDERLLPSVHRWSARRPWKLTNWTLMPGRSLAQQSPLHRGTVNLNLYPHVLGVGSCCG